jgi:hypothetical protein
MSFKVSFDSGTGHDDLDDLDREPENARSTEPEIIEFETAEERRAFMLGANKAAEVTNGWVDAWIEVKAVT